MTDSEQDQEIAEDDIRSAREILERLASKIRLADEWIKEYGDAEDRMRLAKNFVLAEENHISLVQWRAQWLALVEIWQFATGKGWPE